MSPAKRFCPSSAQPMNITSRTGAQKHQDHCAMYGPYTVLPGHCVCTIQSNHDSKTPAHSSCEPSCAGTCILPLVQLLKQVLKDSTMMNPAHQLLYGYMSSLCMLCPACTLPSTYLVSVIWAYISINCINSGGTE